MTVKRYDISQDIFVEVTQEDWDKQENFLQSLVKFLVTPPDSRSEDLAANRIENFGLSISFDLRLKLYQNPMRPGMYFLAEDLEIKAVNGVAGLDGKPVYPSIPPDSRLTLPWALPFRLASEICTRWNTWQDNHSTAVEPGGKHNEI